MHFSLQVFFHFFLILGKRSLQVLQPKKKKDVKSSCTSYLDIHKNEYMQAILSKSCFILCKFFNTEQSDRKYFILRLFLSKLLLKEFYAREVSLKKNCSLRFTLHTNTCLIKSW